MILSPQLDQLLYKHLWESGYGKTLGHLRTMTAKCYLDAQDKSFKNLRLVIQFRSLGVEHVTAVNGSQGI